MQIKYYDILDEADLENIRVWTDQPANHCGIISQGRPGHVTHHIWVEQPQGHFNVVAALEHQFAGKIQLTVWPE